MNRKFILRASGSLGAGLLVLLILTWYNYRDNSSAPPTEEEKRAQAFRAFGHLSSQISVQESEIKGTVRLAIGSIGLRDDSENQKLGDLVLARLSTASGLECVDRQSLSRVLKESEMSLTGLVRAKDAVRVGKLLKADWFLLGTISSVEGKDSLIARVVDARTGIMRDVGVFNFRREEITKLSDQLADFVQDCRKPSKNKKARRYLAFGAFEDLSLNDRQAELPAQLRANLIAAYRQDAGFTLLERESVSTLLREVELDLAGLTDNSHVSMGTMQSAFWLVDGFYQSYENSGVEVEVVFRVQQIFGKRSSVKIRSQPGTRLFQQAMVMIDGEMTKIKSEPTFPTRRSEFRAQMTAGKELCGLSPHDAVTPFRYNHGEFNTREFAKRRRNVEEAIRAFETALLLDPENREAKILLAACLQFPGLNRLSESRKYYEELYGTPGAQWAHYAGWALDAMDGGKPDERIQNADTDPDAQKKAELHLRAAVQESEIVMKGGSGPQYAGYRMDRFVETFGTNSDAACRHLNKLLPDLQKEFPDLAPHLLATALQFQTDTNGPIINEFRQSLAQSSDHPEKMFGADVYFTRLRYHPYEWSMSNGLPGLAAQMMEAKQKYDFNNDRREFENPDKVRLAYAYKGMREWSKALTIFESFKNKPVEMDGEGVWGTYYQPVIPSEEVALCREKLGLPKIKEPGIFQIGQPRFHLHSPAIFIGGETNLWIAWDSQLWNVAPDGSTNFVAGVPIVHEVQVADMCQSESKVYLATTGSGLVEFDRTSHQFQARTYREGLLMDDLASLSLQGDSLWIGFGGPKDGGVGRLDMKTGKFFPITPSLPLDPRKKSLMPNDVDDPPNGPPRHKVIKIAAAKSGNVWMEVEIMGPRVFDSVNNTWKAFSLEESYSAATPRQKEMAVFRSDGSMIPYHPNRRFQKSLPMEGLPATYLTTLTVHDDVLWVGGCGYIAAVDMKQKKLLKLCYVRARTVDHVEIVGEYLWAQFNQHLYSVPLSEINSTASMK